MPLLTLLLALTFAISPLFTPFDGFDPALYPVPQADPPAQPAGWAFSIWGVIYLWLIVSAAFGLWRRRDDPAWAPHRGPLCASLAVGTIWLAVASVSPVWATLLIWVMLAAALVAYLRAPAADPALARAPIGLYAGWLTAASSVSLGLLVAGYGLTGPVAAAWGAVILALVLATAVNLRRPSAAYPAALAWALAAVALRNAGPQPVLAVAAAVAALGMAIWALSALRPAS